MSGNKYNKVVDLTGSKLKKYTFRLGRMVQVKVTILKVLRKKGTGPVFVR